MDFVDEFGRDRDMRILRERLELDNERLHALFASTIEHLCDEMGLEPPVWVDAVLFALSNGWVCDMSNWAKIEDSESLVNITSEASIISEFEAKSMAMARARFFWEGEER